MSDSDRLTGGLALSAEDAAAEAEFSTGILPCQALAQCIATGEISAERPIGPELIQPASLDLRLGTMAFRVRASFLPGSGNRVAEKLSEFTMHSFSLTDGAVLEKGCVYIVPLLESLKLKARTGAMANPKSSTGRLDIFTRIITDGADEFDGVAAGYKGPLYAEISPRTFSVKVRTGSRLAQLRLRRGASTASDAAMKRLHERSPLIAGANGELSDADIESGVALSVDLAGDPRVKLDGARIVGYRAKHHTGVIDIDQVAAYPVADFWDPITAPKGHIVLDPDDFYILASREAVAVPPDHAAEMRAYDTRVGEFRVHYAGFFDPGFGHNAAGGAGSRAVLEVRSHDVPFVLEHGQTVGRLIYERLTALPDRLYGQGIGSNYQAQGLKLSKHFR